jgi:hypothetical protein
LREGRPKGILIHSINSPANPAHKEIRMLKLSVLLFSFVLLTSMLAIAAASKTYQVTGPVLDIKGDVVTVQKGTEKWEIAVDRSTKTTGDLKVGSKVTIEYRMTAATVTVKPAAASKSAAVPPKKN